MNINFEKPHNKEQKIEEIFLCLEYIAEVLGHI